ncbi:hypothetical protein ACN38_g6350 [Penicillium nordicum]|uniref:Uncharacterized protein n=1 Tax=Penicillium nordicum TaxID=229535 RepID=A0A0M8P011_9EURO|nr:hypothetical protein ACN38_g6350 [Penicillium nordicum]
MMLYNALEKIYKETARKITRKTLRRTSKKEDLVTSEVCRCKRLANEKVILLLIGGCIISCIFTYLVSRTSQFCWKPLQS